MRSMTGYSYAEFQDENIKLAAELKSYNNRFLDIAVSAPPALQGAENAIRKYLGDRIARGKVEFYLKIKSLSSQLKVDVDEGAVFAYLDAFKRVKELSGVSDEISLSQLLRADGVGGARLRHFLRHRPKVRLFLLRGCRNDVKSATIG